MPRRRSATLQFNAIRLVGGLLPASLIEQIARQEAPGQKASDYGLPKNLRIQVAVDQAWSRVRALWQEDKELSSRGEGTPWRVWFSSRLLPEVFGWEDLVSCEPRQIEEALYPISHQAFGGKVPVLLTPVETGLHDQGSKAIRLAELLEKMYQESYMIVDPASKAQELATLFGPLSQYVAIPHPRRLRVQLLSMERHLKKV